MKNFCEEMRRGMGRGMIAAMLMTMFPMLLAVLGFLPGVYTEKYHASGLMVNALYKSGLTPVTFIAAAFAYSTSYIGDIANGALRYQLARCGRTRFALSRFWAYAAGVLLFCHCTHSNTRLHGHGERSAGCIHVCVQYVRDAGLSYYICWACIGTASEVR